MTHSQSTLLKSSSAQMMGSLASILAKGSAHAVAINVPESVFLDHRLFPDMFPMSRQVQIACDQVTRGAARLADMQLPSFPDTEITFQQLIDRCRAADAFVQDASSESIDARSDAVITFPVGGGNEMSMKASSFLSGFILPNLYFHAATTYNILRHNGVVLGKKDFLRAG